MDWPNGARAAVNLNIAYEAWEEGVAPGIGPMGNPLSGGAVDTQAINWGSYGWRRGIWRLMEVLDECGIAGSVFTSGRLTELAPDTIAALAAGGHEICAHAWAQNVLPPNLDEPAERDDIERCTTALAALTGDSPRGWLSPRCTPSAHTSRLLAEHGYQWHSDFFDDDLPRRIQTGQGSLVAIPFNMEINDLPLYMRHGHSPEEFVARFRHALAAAKRDRTAGHVDVTVHAHVFGRPAGADAYRQIATMVAEDDEVWSPTKTQLIDWCLEQL